MKDYLPLLEQSPLFHDIDRRNLAPMLSCTGCYEKTFKKNELISLTSDSITCAGLILEGGVHMVDEDIWGEKNILAHMGPEELFGETFACGSITSSNVSFQAALPCRALFFPFHRMLHTCSNSCSFHHRMVENMLGMIADKNYKLMQKIEILSKRTLRKKIFAYLSVQANEHDSRYFEIPLGRLELADYLCTDRSALTRELSLMREEGIIDFDRNTFHILKTEGVGRSRRE